MEHLKTFIVRKRENLKRDEVSHPEHIFRNPVHTADTSQFSERTLFCCLLLFRTLNALTIKTFFVPDEFWQGPEVAHRIAYGYGYLTWEWYECIRGWTSPAIYAVAYQILAVLRFDSALAVTLVPRLVQACFAAVGDLFLYKLAVKRFNSIVGRWTLICYLISWFAFYSVTRTLTNSLETVFTTIALFYWPTSNSDKCSNIEILKSLIFAAVSCLMRPTAAVVWIPLCALHIFSLSNKLSFVVKCILPVGAIAMLWSLVVDSWFYGRLTFVQLNFLRFNVVKNRGTFYGSHPWHWYFSQGFPAIMFTHLVAFAGGIKEALPRQRTLAWLILWTVFIYSFLGHKEFRFISPVLPLAMCYCGLFLSQLSRPVVNGIVAPGSGWKAKFVVLFLALTNIPVALYTVTIHQRGTIDVMGHLQTKSQQLQNNTDMSVLFLMPCHSTPFYSYIHRNISMRFLECPPSDKEGYIDEADLFYLDPSTWLSTYLGNSSTQKGQVILPSHIVFYSVLLPSISNILEDFLYTECARYFHTHFPAERRIGTHVLVYCWQCEQHFHRQDRQLLLSPKLA